MLHYSTQFDLLLNSNLSLTVRFYVAGARLQSACILREAEARTKCHANISVPLVMYKIYIYLHVILYKNKSIEKSPLEMI